MLPNKKTFIYQVDTLLLDQGTTETELTGLQPSTNYEIQITPIYNGENGESESIVVLTGSLIFIYLKKYRNI